MGFVDIADTVGNGMFQRGDDGDREVRDSGGSSKYHKLGVPWMSAPTILSPSSFPQTSGKTSGKVKETKQQGANL